MELPDAQKELNDLLRENGFFDKADRKYATKLVEIIVYGTIAAIGTALIGATIARLFHFI